MPELIVGLQIGPESGAIVECCRQFHSQFRADSGPSIDNCGHIGPGHTKALCKFGNGEVAFFHEQFLQDSPRMGGG